MTSPAARTRISLGALALVLGALATMASGASAAPMTFTVNSPLDPGTGSCDVTECTLREAIVAANGNAGNDTIVFNPANAPYDHVPATPLTVNASEGITIDGGGQVEIGGFGAQQGNGLLFFTSPGVTLQGVTVRGLNVYANAEAGIKICAGISGNTCGYDISNVVIDDVKTYENGSEGILINGANVAGVTLTGIEALQNGEDGIAVRAGNSVSDVTINGVQAATNFGAAVGVEGGPDIHGVTVTDVTSTDSNNGIYVVSITPGASLNDIEVSGSDLTGGDQGIEVVSFGTLTDVLVNGNTVANLLDFGDEGIRVDGQEDVTNARIQENSVDGADSIGLSIYSNGDLLDSVAEGNVLQANSSWGMYFAGGPGSAGNLIRDNTVFNNGEDGIAFGRLEAGGKYQISRNVTYNNGELGIDRYVFAEPDPGVTENDTPDADGLLNFPEWFLPTGYVEATGTACANCLIEVFRSDNDPSGYGEGQEFLLDTTADDNGDFTVAFCGLGLAAGTKVTATATDPAGSTSEFSENYTLLEPSGDCPTPTPSPTASPTPTATPTATATPTPTATPIGQTPTPTAVGQRKHGDVDCSGEVTPVDSLKELRNDAGLDVAQAPGCPQFGSTFAGILWGDVDCTEAVSPVDSLKILRFDAGLSVLQEPGCPALGSVLA